MSINLKQLPFQRATGSVMVVDDDSDVRNLLTRWLSAAGWECSSAESVDTATNRLRTQAADIVITDINMPRLSGISLLKHIKEQVPDTYVLMLTGFGATRSAIDALMLGASAYLLKPVERDELLFYVNQTYERRQLILSQREYLKTLEARVREQTLAIKEAHEETIHRLVTAAGFRDEETGAHIQRTGLCSELVALAAGWTSADAEMLRMAAPMHDIGKIGIPDNILQKRGQLTHDEYEIMKQHTTIGAQMLAGSSSKVLQTAEAIALSHHERWDGTGYPNQLSGDTIPEAARIVSIVDVYDAITHDRVYRSALPAKMALSIMREGRGTQFDPTYLALFFTALEDIQAIAYTYPDAVSRPCDRLAEAVETATTAIR
jgi:putative two-component system response regulator